MQTAIQRFRSISATPSRAQPSGPQDADGERLANHVCWSSQPTRSTYDFRAVRGSCQLRQRDCGLLVSACRQRCHFPIITPPTTCGRTREWVQRYNDTPQRHGRLGTPSSPPSWRPLNPRTLTPCSPPHPSYEANSINFKLRYHNKWTHPHFSLNHWERPSVNTGPKKRWSTRYNKRHINSFFLASQRTTSESHPYLTNSQKHRNTPTTTQQRSLRGGR